MSWKDIAHIGVGSPGTCNPETGIVEYANNLQFENVPVRDILEKELDKKVFLDNDANAAAYAESLAGGAKGSKISVCITLGTGWAGESSLMERYSAASILPVRSLDIP